MPLITGRPLGTDPYCLVRLDGVAHDDCALIKCTRKPVVRPSVCKERRSVREVVAILMVNVMLSSRDGRTNLSILLVQEVMWKKENDMEYESRRLLLLVCLKRLR